MTAIEIANKIVELCKQGRNAECKFMYADDAVSVEAFAPPGMNPVSQGLAAIEAKGKWWRDNHVINSFHVAGPWPLGQRFIIGYQWDVTMKHNGQRMQMEEMGLYTVENGKVVREEFFYHGGA